MFIVSVDWDKDISCELLSHITRNLYLMMVIGYGRILAEDENTFSLVVCNGCLSDENVSGQGKDRKIYMKVFMF